MSRKYNPATVGAFVLGAVLLAILAVVFLGGGALFRSSTTHVSYFPGSIKGLEIGAPVNFRGVRVGSVVDIQAVYNIDKNLIYLPVIYELERGRLQAVGDEAKLPFDPNDPEAALKHLIGLGLRARLDMRSLVTGQLVIELDMYPDSPAVLKGYPSEYLEIPALPTSIEQLKERIEGFFEKLEDLPISDIVKNLADAIAGVDQLINSKRTASIAQGIDRFVNSPELKASLSNLDRALVSFDAAMRSAQAFMGDADGRLEPAFESFMSASAALETALKDAGQLIESAKDSISEDSDLRARSSRAIVELEAAAEAVRVLADYLARHPEALIKGKPSPGDER